MDALGSLPNVEIAQMRARSAPQAQAKAETSPSIGNLLAKHKASPEQLQKMAKDYEAVFITQLLQPMFAGLDTDPEAGGGGSAEESYRGLMLQEYGKVFAARGGLGMTPILTKEFLRLQEK